MMCWAAASDSDARLGARPASFHYLTVWMQFCPFDDEIQPPANGVHAKQQPRVLFACSYERREKTSLEYCKYCTYYKEQNLVQDVSRASNYS